MRDSRENFLKRKAIGDKGEAFMAGWLYSRYGHKLKHVSEYHPNGYRWDNIALPDFLLKDEENNVLIEVKCKQGWKGMLNLSVKQVKGYLKVAEKSKSKLELIFFCMDDLKIYRLTQETLKKPTSTITPRQKPEDPFFLYDRDDQEVVFEGIPSDIFNSEIIG
jgi:hypothetical protein